MEAISHESDARYTRIIDLRKGSREIRDAYQTYLARVDETSEIMKEMGLLRMPVDLYSSGIITAEITPDQRLVTTGRHGRFFRIPTKGEYHLKDLTEMLGLFGKNAKNLSQFSREDIERVEKMLPRLHGRELKHGSLDYLPVISNS